MKTIEVLTQIVDIAENIKCDLTQRFPEAASPGDFWRQGDIYITLLDSLPENAERVVVNLQLAPGTTKGSRHILSHGNLRMYRLSGAGALTGPIVKNKRTVTVTHPEHGNVVLPPGIYAITYQRAFADELRRQLD